MKRKRCQIRTRLQVHQPCLFSAGQSWLCYRLRSLLHSTRLIVVIVVLSSIAMALFGGIGAYLGGSSVKVSAARVLFGGWITMGITYGLLKPLDKDRKG
ncbi:hypothetical protein Acr_27g0000130 [Actinidia rufa]|uniref:Vacuolar iron transporter n=1 Tax=Actinidia rufa TaxID=165716 RepID=A0A7J0H688_9ERIC|nr:hypothetical protein Acr_27g0000130 [Actinidia rufa]